MIGHFPHGAKVASTTDLVNDQFDSSINWESAKEIRDLWDGPFMLKGIQSVEDAKKAAELGVTGIILSNHGGRQLDGAPAAMDILPEVIEAVGNDVEVLIDGGVRRGSDVIKAIALGAKACLIGRAYLYGLAAGGEAGVTQSYNILVDEMIRTMRLIGCTSIAELDASYDAKTESSEPTAAVVQDSIPDEKDSLEVQDSFSLSEVAKKEEEAPKTREPEAESKETEPLAAEEADKETEKEEVKEVAAKKRPKGDPM
ncbi:unnamed protein product, partial [Cyprideis torosa]